MRARRSTRCSRSKLRYSVHRIGVRIGAYVGALFPFIAGRWAFVSWPTDSLVRAAGWKPEMVYSLSDGQLIAAWLAYVVVLSACWAAIFGAAVYVVVETSDGSYPRYMRPSS